MIFGIFLAAVPKHFWSHWCMVSYLGFGKLHWLLLSTIIWCIFYTWTKAPHAWAVSSFFYIHSIKATFIHNNPGGRLGSIEEEKEEEVVLPPKDVRRSHVIAIGASEVVRVNRGRGKGGVAREAWRVCRDCCLYGLCLGKIVIEIRVARWYMFKPKIPIWVNFGVTCNERCW
jgi:hypothetical protein